MKTLNIGVDPDSDKHGVAWSWNSVTMEYTTMTLFDLYRFLLSNMDVKIVIHYEDVLKNNKIFKKKGVRTRNVFGSVARKVGSNQQSLKEMLKMIDEVKHPDLKLVAHKISKRWKDSQEGKYWMMIHWGIPPTQRNNADERSAAYFLTVGCKK